MKDQMNLTPKHHPPRPPQLQLHGEEKGRMLSSELVSCSMCGSHDTFGAGEPWIHEILKKKKKRERERTNQRNEEDIPSIHGAQKASLELLKGHRMIRQPGTRQEAPSLAANTKHPPVPYTQVLQPAQPSFFICFPSGLVIVLRPLPLPNTP